MLSADFPRFLTGVYYQNRKKHFATSTDRRFKQDIRLTNAEDFTLHPGQLLALEIPEDNGHSYYATGKILHVLGSSEDPSTYSLVAVHNAGIPAVFSPETEAAADAAKAVPLGNREDLRAIPLITIDGEDARDFDDAVYAAPYHSPEYGDGFHIIVAIADVSHYVKPDSALDVTARERGNSVYFPDRVVPMLPEALSNGWCSLKPGEERGCLAVHLWIDGRGRKHKHRFCRGLMKSAGRYTYTAVEEVIKGNTHDPLLAPLYAAYQALRKARVERGALEIVSYEHKIRFDENHEVTRIEPAPHLIAHQVIEEMMVLANVAAAELLDNQRLAALYRVHPAPSADRMMGLNNTLKHLNIGISKGAEPTPQTFNSLLSKAVSKPFERLVQQSVLQTQAQANYSPDNVGHFGLGLDRYCHFTSPIRRYADLVVHRALLAHLGEKDGAVEPVKALNTLAGHLSKTERRAAGAERDATARFVARFYAQRMGEHVVCTVVRAFGSGRIVVMSDSLAEAFIPRDFIGDDRYRFDEVTQTLQGIRRRRVYGVGDSLRCEVYRVDTLTGQVLLRVVDVLFSHRTKPAGKDGEKPSGKPQPKRRDKAKKNRPSQKECKKAAKHGHSKKATSSRPKPL
ncbi:MAG: ribonuclease R family protein [Holosporales bacterium]